MDDLRSTLADFDPDAPLPGMPDPWDFMPTPADRPGPPWAMAEMIAAEPGLADRDRRAARRRRLGRGARVAGPRRGGRGRAGGGDRLRHVRARGDGARRRSCATRGAPRGSRVEGRSPPRRSSWRWIRRRAAS